jgi:hypothetical protein
VVNLKQGYIYGGQIIGPGDVDLDDYDDEIAEAITEREEAFDAKVEQRSIVDQTQSSRLAPMHIRPPDDTNEETVTPVDEDDERVRPASGVQAAPVRPRPRPVQRATPPPGTSSESSSASGAPGDD